MAGQERERGRPSLPTMRPVLGLVVGLALLACHPHLASAQSLPNSGTVQLQEESGTDTRDTVEGDADSKDAMPTFRLLWLPLAEENETIQRRLIDSQPMLCVLVSPLVTNASHLSNSSTDMSINGSLSYFANSTQGDALNSSRATPNDTQWNPIESMSNFSSVHEMNDTQYDWWNCTQDFSSVPTNNFTYDTTENPLHSEKSDFAKAVATTTEMSVGDLVTRNSSYLSSASLDISPSSLSPISDALNVSSTSVLPFVSVPSERVVATSRPTPPVELPLSNSASHVLLLDETNSQMVANGYLTSFPADTQLQLVTSKVDSDTITVAATTVVITTTPTTSRNQFISSSQAHDSLNFVDAGIPVDTMLASSKLDLSSHMIAPSVTLGILPQSEAKFSEVGQLSSIASSQFSVVELENTAQYQPDIYQSSSSSLYLSSLPPIMTPSAIYEAVTSPYLEYPITETPPLSTGIYASRYVSSEPPISSPTQQQTASSVKTMDLMSKESQLWETGKDDELLQGDEAYVSTSASAEESRVTSESFSKVLATGSLDTRTSNSIEISPSISSEWKDLPSSTDFVLEPPSRSMNQFDSSALKPSSNMQLLGTENTLVMSSSSDISLTSTVSGILVSDALSIQPSILSSEQQHWSATPVLDISMATRSSYNRIPSTSVDTVQQTEFLPPHASDHGYDLSASSALSSLDLPSEFVILPSSVKSSLEASAEPPLLTSSPVSSFTHPVFSEVHSLSPTSLHAVPESTDMKPSSQELGSPSKLPESVTASSSSTSSMSNSMITPSSSSPLGPVSSNDPASSPHSTPLIPISPRLPPYSTTLPPIPQSTTVFTGSEFPIRIKPTSSVTSASTSTTPPLPHSPSSLPTSPPSPMIKTSSVDAIPNTSFSPTALAITPSSTLPVLTQSTQRVQISNNQMSTSSSWDTTSAQQGVTDTVSELISTASTSTIKTTSPTTSVQSKEIASSVPSTHLVTTSSSTSSTTSPTITISTVVMTTTAGNQLTTSSSATTSSDNKHTTLTNQPSTVTSTAPVVKSSTSDEKVIVTTTDISTSTSASTSTRITASTTPPTVRPLVTEPPLNTTEWLMEYWVKTVIEEPLSADVTNISYVGNMEMKLSQIYDEGFQRLIKNNVRRRRATTSGDTTLQMVNVTRGANNKKMVTLVYYMERFGNLTPALDAVAAMETFNVQEITLRLGVIVHTKAEVYAPPAEVPREDPKLWLIAAVLGGIVGFIIFIWCILFIYCKCTQPVKQRQRTPRTPRSTRISMTGEYDTNSYRNKMPKIQGFDIARTEVGLENEIQRDLKRKPPEPYRRRPDGSTELEGMYSGGETPPPKQAGDSYTNTPPGKIRESGEGEEVTPVASLNMNKSRSQIPIDASLRRSLPPRPDSMETLHPPKKKSSSRKKRAESEESESEDEVSEDRKPLSIDWNERKEKKAKKKSNRSRQEEKPRSKSKKKHRKSDDVEGHDMDTSPAGVYENIAKLSRNDPDRPEKLRSTQHAIKLPPLITQPLVGEPLSKSLREETELQESLQQKADIERWRNKQRQRERTKGSKSARTHHESDPRETRLAYKRAQREIAAILGDPEAVQQMPEVFQKKKKRKKRSRPPPENVSDPDQDDLDTRNMVRPATAQYSSAEGPVDKHRSPAAEEPEESNGTGDSSDDEDENDSYLDELQVNEPSLDEARQRMHELVDNAFALISPRYRKQNRIAPIPLLLPPRGPAPLPAHGKASARVRRRQLPTINRGVRHIRSQGQDQGTRNIEEDTGPKHTPLYITPVTRRTSKSGEVIWSPYNASDEVAHMPGDDDQQPVPGVIQTTPEVSRRKSDSSEASLIKPMRSVAAYNYTNPAYVNDSDGTHSGKDIIPLGQGPVRHGSQSLASTSLSRTTTTNSSGADSGSIVKTPRELREALQHDGYTSLYMDSSYLNPKAAPPRSHSPPERDEQGYSSQKDVSMEEERSDFVSKENQENAKHLAQNGVAKVFPFGSQSDSLFQSQDSLSQSKGPFHMLSEQTSLNLPSTEVLDIGPGSAHQKDNRSKEPTEIRLKHLDPKIPTLCETGDMDEIDVIQKARKKRVDPSVRSHWNKSLRSELERLANHSSADTTITTTAMV